ncbi:apurinic/apyrimidinic endonuclease family protein [Allosalinactinospora lopnorensis]|uniref:hypothetical protein n=1 Tax=Allosalinactinospora lopnorensis TaxID=1352348 RepID=UPI000623D8CD|nr:hypothetical protein [Allosalinactinospora lopnorensis]
MSSDQSDKEFSERYKEEYRYLLEYARVDWVIFYVVHGQAVAAAGKCASEEQQTNVMISLISDLYDAGVRSIDLLPTDHPPYAVWNLNKEDTLQRIRQEFEDLEEECDMVDIC